MKKQRIYKIGVFGSDASKHPKRVEQIARTLGKVLAAHKAIVVTGACSGLPYVAAKEAYEHGSKVWGFSPEINLANQRSFTPDDELSIYDKLVYVPKTYEFVQQERVCKKYRNVASTASCNAGIIISGRWGSLNEFTNLFDMGKVIGVLTGTGGTADEIKRLAGKIHKPGKAIVLYDSSPARLIRKMIRELDIRS